MTVVASVSVSDTYPVGSENPSDGFFAITFPFAIDPATVRVYTKGSAADDAFVLKVQDTDWTLDEGGSRMSFITETYEPVNGDTVFIERFTSRTRVNDYSPGGTVTADLMDTDNNQEFYILQEMEAKLANALQLDLTGSFWDGEGTRSSNCAEATTDTGWTTLGQVSALLAGEVPAAIDGADLFTFTGDGVETEFELSLWSDLTRARIILSINGLVQHAYDDTIYDVLNTGEVGYPASFNWSALKFVNPPANNDIIEARAIKGTVSSVIGGETIVAAALADNCLEIRHFGGSTLSPATDSRLVHTSSGDPVFEVASSIDLFEATLNTWLGTKQLTDLLNSDASPFGNQKLRMDDNKISGLKAGTVNTDAVNLGQVNTLLQISNVAIGELANISATVQTKTLAWRPDIVIIVGNSIDPTIGSNYQSSWIAMFQHATTVRVASGAFLLNDSGEDAQYAHILEVKKTSNGFSVSQHARGEGGTNGNVQSAQYIAIKI